MGTVLLKVKVMPEAPDTDLEALKTGITESLTKAGALKIDNIEEEEIAFGLKALIVTIAWPEEKSTDEAVEQFLKIEGVSSIDVIDYRRAFG